MDPEKHALRVKFHDEIVGNYYLLKDQCGYEAAAMREMVQEYGGEGAAHRLLALPRHGEELERLKKAGRLDLSLEATVLKPEFESLFSDEELRVATKRLKEYGWSE